MASKSSACPSVAATPSNPPACSVSHVVFGAVTEGLDILSEMEAVAHPSGATTQELEIVDCGELTEEK